MRRVHREGKGREESEKSQEKERDLRAEKITVDLVCEMESSDDCYGSVSALDGV